LIEVAPSRLNIALDVDVKDLTFSYMWSIFVPLIYIFSYNTNKYTMIGQEDIQLMFSDLWGY